MDTKLGLFHTHLLSALFAQDFKENPLNFYEVKKCYNTGLSIEQTINIAYEVQEGFTFTSCVESALEEMA